MPALAAHPDFLGGRKSAFLVYSQQIARKKKMKRNKNSKPSLAVKKLLKLKGPEKLCGPNVIARKYSGRGIVPSATPELAKPDRKCKVESIVKPNLDSVVVNTGLLQDSSAMRDNATPILKSTEKQGIQMPPKKKKSGLLKSSSASGKVSKQKKTVLLNGTKLKKSLGVAANITNKDVTKSSKKPRKDSKSSCVSVKPTKNKAVLSVPLKCDDSKKVLKSDAYLKNMPPALRMLHMLELIDDSKDCGASVLNFMLSPISQVEFFKTYWEKKHLLVKREDRNYFVGIFSTQVLDAIFRQHYVEYTKNIDVTSYSDGVRQTHNPIGRVYPPVVWDYFSNGCSLRMLNPQTFHKPVWQMLSAMQEFMGSFCGANVYLTPAGTQGFAPHWDDIEAFILQLDGKKRWRVYEPRNINETLPRNSSANLSQDEIGQPILNVILEAGDILYFPRGFIHQAEALEDVHSLHITISTYQKNAWVDLFEKMFDPSVLAEVAANSVFLREGLPLGCLNYMGQTASALACTSECKNVNRIERKRKQLKDKAASLLMHVLLTSPALDHAVDAIAQRLVRVALPPVLSRDLHRRTVAGDGERWHDGTVVGRVEVDPDTRVKLLTRLIIRVVRDPSDARGEYRVYHSAENSREYEGRGEQFLLVEDHHLPAVHHLVREYPRYTRVDDLPLATLEDKVTVVMALWEQHLLVTSEPLSVVDD